MGYSSWGHKESELTEYTHTHTHTHTVTPVEEQLSWRLRLAPLPIHLVMGHKSGPKSGYYVKTAHGTRHQKCVGNGEKPALKLGARS